MHTSLISARERPAQAAEFTPLWCRITTHKKSDTENQTDKSEFEWENERFRNIASPSQLAVKGRGTTKWWKGCTSARELNFNISCPVIWQLNYNRKIALVQISHPFRHRCQRNHKFYIHLAPMPPPPHSRRRLRGGGFLFRATFATPILFPFKLRFIFLF